MSRKNRRDDQDDDDRDERRQDRKPRPAPKTKMPKRSHNPRHGGRRR